MPTDAKDFGAQPDASGTADLAARSNDRLEAGTRCGRYVVVFDVEGRRHALSAGSVSAICDDESGGCILLIGGGRMVRLDEPMEVLLRWFT
ncbi:hypothetical protein [Dankookia sp. P2]|uniref:hypothetical protein n=1 Tax=Dankookia sp. P2 TaxID=3423955 RepID=UPI003D665213